MLGPIGNAPIAAAPIADTLEAAAAPSGCIMSSLAASGGLAGMGGIAGAAGGLAG